MKVPALASRAELVTWLSAALEALGVPLGRAKPLARFGPETRAILRLCPHLETSTGPLFEKPLKLTPGKNGGIPVTASLTQPKYLYTGEVDALGEHPIAAIGKDGAVFISHSCLAELVCEVLLAYPGATTVLERFDPKKVFGGVAAKAKPASAKKAPKSPLKRLITILDGAPDAAEVAELIAALPTLATDELKELLRAGDAQYDDAPDAAVLVWSYCVSHDEELRQRSLPRFLRLCAKTDTAAAMPYREALMRDPSARTAVDLAVCHAQLGQIEEATACLLRAMQLSGERDPHGYLADARRDVRLRALRKEPRLKALFKP